MSISTAIGTDRLSRVSGYQINKGNFSNATPNLPQQVVILGEANTANQGTLNTAATEITTADQAGKLYGYGSPIHQIARILRPISGDGIGGISTFVMAQASDAGAAATVIVWTVTGTATANATHKIIINGRDSLDYFSYAYSVVDGDTPTIIAGKIRDVVNSVLNTPFIATSALGVLTLTTKWKGATSAAAKATISTNNNVSAGLTYALTSTTTGSGAVDLSSALAQFESTWYTTIINSYGTATLDALEAFNGVPDNTTPTGRWDGRTFKPFMAFFGSTLSVATDLSAITDAAARVSQVTNVLCAAPGSDGFPWEAAANVVTLFCRQMQDNPHLNLGGKSYPDMPVPASGIIGDMAAYNNRDYLVKKGCSTVRLLNGAYVIQDLVTTYHPTGEVPLQFNYCRNLNLDWNVKDAYTTLEKIYVRDKVIVKDNQVTNVTNAIKPSEWKAIVFELFDNLGQIALLSDPAFSKASLQVGVSSTNPNRFETSFNYKRTGTAEIESTTATAGF